MKVTIANMNIVMDLPGRHFHSFKCQQYENLVFNKPDMILKTTYLDKVNKPQGETIGPIGDVTIVSIGDNQFCRYYIRKKTEEILIAVYHNQIYSEIDIELLSKSLPRDPSPEEYQYVYSGLAFSDRLTELGGTVLHGSGIAYNNQGIIFSANCGTGKSTHTGLWKERFGDHVTIVNDDKPAIRFYDGIPYIFGTPWSGKTDLNTNVEEKLKSIVFIKQSETNWIERLNTRDSIFSLMTQIARPYYDEKLGLKTMGIIEKLVQTIPIYRLHCNISQEAVDVVYQQLIKEGVIVS